MFCPNCSQSFRSDDHKCPTCGFYLGSAPPVRVSESQSFSKAGSEGGSEKASSMDAGVRRGVNLMLIAVACLPVFKVLAWLYPQRDFLVADTRSVDVFERGGTAILVVLFGAGILRSAYALTIERKRDARMLNQ